MGAHTLNLNKTFEISYHASPVSNNTIVFLKNDIIMNMTLNHLKEIGPPFNHFEKYNNKFHNSTHFYTIYAILIMTLTMITVIALKIYKNKIVDRKESKVDKLISVASKSSCKNSATSLNDNKSSNESLAPAKSYKESAYDKTIS